MSALSGVLTPPCGCARAYTPLEMLIGGGMFLVVLIVLAILHWRDR